MDIRIKTEDNKHIDVEVQVVDKKDMINRSIFYAASLYTEQMKEGMRYKNLGRTIALNILCFNLFKDDKEYINSYRFKNRQNNKELTDILEINFVELKKVKDLQLDNMKDLWATFLSAESEEELKMLALKNGTINKAVETLKYVSADDVIRFEYDQRRKAKLDHAAEMAEKLEEGIEIGREEGREEGEMKKAVVTAKTALEEGLPIELISKLTGLGIEKIEELKNSELGRKRTH